jgi:uncharacterized protein RhaS with RHS repeats
MEKQEEKKIRRISVYQVVGPADFPAGEQAAGEGLLQRTTDFHPEWNKPIAETQYDSQGNVEQQTEYAYDGQGFLVRELLKESDGEVVEERSFEPDDQQRMKKEFRHYADGSFDVTEFSYDENGRLIKKVLADDEGEVERVEEFEYQDDKPLLEKALDGEGNLLMEVRYLYNEEGLLEEVHAVNPEEGEAYQKVHEYTPEGKRKSTLVYDGEGELVERYLFEMDDNGHPATLVEETRMKKNTIRMKNDAKGQVVFQEEHDLNGELVSRVARRYDELGKLLESRVAVRNPRLGLLQEYSVFQQYEYFNQ